MSSRLDVEVVVETTTVLSGSESVLSVAVV